jgi:hypothetical protein
MQCRLAFTKEMLQLHGQSHGRRCSGVLQTACVCVFHIGGSVTHIAALPAIAAALFCCYSLSLSYLHPNFREATVAITHSPNDNSLGVNLTVIPHTKNTTHNYPFPVSILEHLTRRYKSLPLSHAHSNSSHTFWWGGGGAGERRGRGGDWGICRENMQMQRVASAILHASIS